MTIPVTGSRSEILTVMPEAIRGHRVERAPGLARGSHLRAKHVGTDIVAALRNVLGGEVEDYASPIAGAGEQAMDRMRAETSSPGAPAVVGLRLQSSLIRQGASEVPIRGTVVLRRMP